MTEFKLKNNVRMVTYGMAALFMFFLAIQNYRYGFYDLVYTASLLIPIFGFGIVFTYAQRYIEIKDYTHQILLALMIILIAINIKDESTNAIHWIYPIGLLSYLILPFKAANNFNSIALSIITLVIFYIQGVYSGLLFFTSYLLVSGVAGIFAYLHHHKSRSLIELSLHDALTGAYNIKHLDDTLAKEISRSDVTGNALSLIALKIDYFEQFTELNGNKANKEVVIELSKMLGGMIRAGDSHYFSEGSPFYLFLPNTPQEGVLIMAERVRRTIEESNWSSLDSMTVSLGCTTSLNNQATAKSLLDEVHNALNEAESNGHNRVNHHTQ